MPSPSECFLCGEEVKRSLYDHLFKYHDYTKEQLERLKWSRNEIRKRGNVEENNILFRCENCEMEFSLKNSLHWHRRSCPEQPPCEPENGSVKCPKCDGTVRDLKELVKHYSMLHCMDEGYNVSKISFDSKGDFEEWMKLAQDASITSFVTRSKKIGKSVTRVYYRCHRSGPSPLSVASTNTCKRSVSHCTAFINAKFTSAQVHVEYCLAHAGHEPDPALLWLDKHNEQLIVDMLKEGFNYGQVKQKIRERYRNSNGNNVTENRLFFVTTGDIRAISRRNNLFPGRRDLNDITSLEKRIGERNVSDGIRYYAPSLNDTGDGFCLVIINETQRKWLTDFSQRGVGIDDTFNVSMYKLRLATIIVADHSDRALPAAFMLSFRMSESELVILFDKVKELVPAFAPDFFMSDDAASFHNAFLRVFPNAHTRKILCNWHVLQAFKRSARKKLTKPSLLGEFMSRIRLVSRSCKPVIFTKRYGDNLTFLLNEGQHDLVDYLHRNWTQRVEEWGAHHRKGAVMNTSMMCERWHKHLKREVFCSKSKIRIDELVDALITTVKEMKDDAAVIEQRGLVEGRWRLQNHHISHNKAISIYGNMRELIHVVEPGLWKVRSHKSDTFFMVEEERCPCTKELNHCRKPGCSACPYSFFCECDEDRKAGISCMHIHAVNLYASQGRLPNIGAMENLASSVDIGFPDAALDIPSTSRFQPSGVSDQNRSDRNKELIQQIEMEYAVLHSLMLRAASDSSEETGEFLNEALASMKRSVAKGRLSITAPVAKKRRVIAPRPELPMRGPAAADAKPIRMQTTSSLNRSKRKAKIETHKEYAIADVRVCGYCFLENPLGSDSNDVYWLKCTSCNTWSHLNNCAILNSKCTVCSFGTMEYSEC